MSAVTSTALTTTVASGNASAVAAALRAEIHAWNDVFFAKTQPRPTQQGYKTDPAIRTLFPFLLHCFVSLELLCAVTPFARGHTFS